MLIVKLRNLSGRAVRGPVSCVQPSPLAQKRCIKIGRQPAGQVWTRPRHKVWPGCKCCVCHLFAMAWEHPNRPGPKYRQLACQNWVSSSSLMAGSGCLLPYRFWEGCVVHAIFLCRAGCGYFPNYSIKLFPGQLNFFLISHGANHLSLRVYFYFCRSVPVLMLGFYMVHGGRQKRVFI